MTQQRGSDRDLGPVTKGLTHVGPLDPAKFNLHLLARYEIMGTTPGDSDAVFPVLRRFHGGDPVGHVSSRWFVKSGWTLVVLIGEPTVIIPPYPTKLLLLMLNRMTHPLHWLLGLLLVWWIQPGISLAQETVGDSTFYSENVYPIFVAHCVDCHGPDEQESQLRLDSRRSLLKGGDSGEPAVVPSEPDRSFLLHVIGGEDEDLRMPPDGDLLSTTDQATIRAWIESGAAMPELANDQERGADHWSFQPIQRPVVPDTGTDRKNPIDAFIIEKLQQNQLGLSPEADRRTLIRRLYLVMHGLPPTPSQIEQFLNNTSPTAWQDLVDEVLESPRYGERWARHWLDLIRFGETHGFETNRERPNAWRYRDWVIQALNEDKPYDQFIQEQIAGDALGEPIGTGYLVAGPHDIVKSPDINLTLMQKQDELSDLVNTTGTSLLGLTLGCARCHNHKFDPISQKDFYSIQAVFAGVEHGDRTLPVTPESQARLESLQPRIQNLQERLLPFIPKAGMPLVMIDEAETADAAGKIVEHRVEPAGEGINPGGTQPGFQSDPGTDKRTPNLSRGKYTWWKNTPHQDTVVYRPRVTGRHRLWISWGAGHSTHTQDARYILDLDGDLSTTDDQQEVARIDQRRLAEEQDVADDTATPNQSLWSGLFNAGSFLFSGQEALVVRGGTTGSAVTSDLIAWEPLSEASGTSSLVKPRLRPPVNSKQNIEWIVPVETRFVRFTILATNSSQPCLDELEIYAGGKNVALAEQGGVATCSSTLPGYDIHQLKHINDGRYGNPRSWISNEDGQGWIQIELPAPKQIDRIEWGRDRDGQFSDRVATQYRIEVSLDGESWRTIASSGDRMPFGTDGSKRPTYVFDGVEPEVAQQGRDALAELEQLLEEQRQLNQTPTVYAGMFNSPPATFRLYRGDPLAKREEVNPDTISLLGTLGLTNEAKEQERRLKFAKWVASRENPLTARVMMNRLWQFHFGTGIVSTPNDFGGNGVPPSHPELLDWLADEFMAQDWSLKEMHRQILLSQTWQQDSRPTPEGLSKDAASQLLWRFPPRRLEAEAIRDSMLLASGVLDLTMGGPGFSGFEVQLENVRHFFPKTRYGPEDFRRMVYMTVVRQERESVFGVFDCPDASQVVSRRSRSTTPLQALNLLNSEFTMTQSEFMAQRLAEANAADAAEQASTAFELCYGRPIADDELPLCVEFIQNEGLEQFCRALFNSNEFLFVP